MGALRLRQPDSIEWLSSESGVANVHDLDKILAAAGRYEADAATDEDLAYLSDIATSPGGARPKANVLLDSGKMALAKLPHSKDGNVDVEGWEGLALTIANRAGLRVPTFRTLRASENGTVLVVDRFDRTGDGRRLGYMSAATAMSIGKHDDSRRTYQEFADTIAEMSADPQAELREMFGRVALSVLINNADDHWKNHGFVRAERGWKLAPVFDVNPNPRRGGINSRAISDVDDPRHRDIRNLYEISESFQLTRDDAARVIQSVAGQVESWRQVAQERGISDVQQATMAPAFDAEQLAVAKSLGPHAHRANASVAESTPSRPRVWVAPYNRNGQQIDGYWRKS